MIADMLWHCSHDGGGGDWHAVNVFPDALARVKHIMLTLKSVGIMLSVKRHSRVDTLP